MPETRTPNRTALETLLDELCALLEALGREHRALLGLSERKHRAISGAKHADLAACMRDESEVVQRIALIEQRREPVVGAIVQALGGPPIGAGRHWRANSEWIAARVVERYAERLRRHAGEVHEVIDALRTRNRAAVVAAETLARHIQGIIRTVDQRLNASGAYTPRGVVAAPASTLCGVDITS